MTTAAASHSGARLAWAQLLRVPNLFTAVADVAAGMALAGGALPGWPTAVALLAASTCLYGGGIVLNDVFDVEVDRRERPRRPLPSARVVLAAARRIGLVLLIAGVGLAAVAGGRAALIAVAIAGLAFAYDAGLKRQAVIGAVALAGCRYLNLLMGVAIAPLTTASALLPLPLALYILAIMPMSRVEVTGGGRAAPLLSGLLAGAALIAAAALAVSGRLYHPWGVVAVAVVVGLVGAAIVAAVRTPTPDRLQAAIRRMLLGLIPLDAALATCGPHPWVGAAIVALLFPARWLSRRIPMT